MTVRLTAEMSYSDETIVDCGIGTPAEQQAASDRIDARRAAVHAAWMALPLWERAWATVRFNRRLRKARRRLDHMARAARGVECDR